MPPRPTTISELFDRYDGMLLDAYGVLVDASGALPEAPSLIAALHRRQMPYAIVTNDASRSVATYVAKLAGLGMPVDGDRFENGTVYVASADRHLMFDEHGIRVTRGAKEGRVRPSIDVLFRSAAAVFGARVIGVILTGALDDGTAGLWAVKGSRR